VRRLHRVLTGPDSGTSKLERYERLAGTARLLVRHASGREPTRRGAGRLVAARIRELIQDRTGEVGGGELTADDLAAAAGCSRYAAYRAFRQAYGLSPSDYQRQLRVRAARRLLSAGAAPAEVAADAGFADQAHLTRWFRRYYGVTPGAYRAAAGGPAGH
jgi:AraC-like DNA-binding protein